MLAHIFVPSSFVRPVCGGVHLAETTTFAGGFADVRVFGCATDVSVTCEAPVAASLPGHFVVAGDMIRISAPIPMAAGGDATCALASDQGRVTFRVTQP